MHPVPPAMNLPHPELANTSRMEDSQALATAYGLPVEVVNGIKTIISAIQCGTLTRQQTPPHFWQFRGQPIRQRAAFSLGEDACDKTKILLREIDGHISQCRTYQESLSRLASEKPTGKESTKESGRFLSRIGELLTEIHGYNGVEEILTGSNSKRTPQQNLNLYLLANEIIVRLERHLKHASTLLTSLKHCLESVIHGEIPSQPFFFDLIQKYQEEDKPGPPIIGDRITCDGLKLVCNPIILITTSKKLTPQQAQPGGHFQELYCTCVATKSSSSGFFARFAIFNLEYLSINRNNYGLNFLINTEITKQLELFFHKQGIKHILDAFAGLGMFQAAMKSIGSNIEITSIDNFSELENLKPAEGQTRSFFPACDDVGVLCVNDSFKYLETNKHLVKKDTCLFFAFPSPKPECLMAMQNLLKLWAKLHGGLVVVLSDAAKESLLFGNVFRGKHLIRKKLDAKLPAVLLRSYPQLKPRIFHVEEAGNDTQKKTDTPCPIGLSLDHKS